MIAFPRGNARSPCESLFKGSVSTWKRHGGGSTAITDYERSIQARTVIFEAFDGPGSVSRETDRRPQPHPTKRIAGIAPCPDPNSTWKCWRSWNQIGVARTSRADSAETPLRAQG